MSWDPQTYRSQAAFVPELANDIIALLNPQEGETILDIGCGEGSLTTKFAKPASEGGFGCNVAGIDFSQEMIDCARKTVDPKWKVEFKACDAQDPASYTELKGQFDAVFSNAALHWMNRDPPAVVRGARSALKDGGRFACEMGGACNIAAVHVALLAVARRYGGNNSMSPWYFPTKEEYKRLLEENGFRVVYIESVPRPTPLPKGMRSWLDTLATTFFKTFPPEIHDKMKEEVCEELKPVLCDSSGNWTADYVRLRAKTKFFDKVLLSPTMISDSVHAASTSVNDASEQDIVSEATRRKCMLANIYFIDYYLDLLDYTQQRRMRTEDFKRHNDGKAEDWKVYCGKERTLLRKRRTRTRLTSFEILSQIGQGGYGQVFLAKKKDTSEICALKKMSKKLLLCMGEVDHILTERDILTWSNSVWLIKLLYAFQDVENVYLAMEYAPGGDMRTLLNNSGVLREEHARFYIAEMLVAVSSLHKLGYIHRDLKPENFLIDKDGHVKLTDFGLSRGKLNKEFTSRIKEKMEKVKDFPFIHRSLAERRNLYKSWKVSEVRAFSQVGSPDYMAPEVLMHVNDGYSLEVDYWSLGCILFECLAGFPPFTAPSVDDVWVNVYHWRKVLERPIYTGEDEEFNFSDPAWNLVTCLIADRKKRMTNMDIIEEHPFFSRAHFKFSNLRTPEGFRPPFVPNLKSITDTSYFDDFSNVGDMTIYKEVRDRQEAIAKKAEEADSESKTEGLRTAFIGFTFKHTTDSFSGLHGSMSRKLIH
ncbi:hypothetical protein HDU97_003613 [Phlyctochytrium planicorne]|nr:hypothetical protein HDU97_003613 [Phlyctochytrium planicorne]